MSHKIPNFPSTTGVLRHFICPKFAPPDPLVGWGGENPLPIPYPRRRLRHLDLSVPNFISRKLATLVPYCTAASLARLVAISRL